MVDELSGGRLAYVWVPNTGGGGVNSFNRYFFAQQDKEGAVIDERFNGGGMLDDYMVDYMTRTLRAAITNEVPGGRPLVLPQGVLGPKVLIINERAGSGGARVTLLDGSAMVLRGTNDVNSSISGISVSDPTLGEVKLEWDEFDRVRFHPADAEPGWGFFDGGHPTRGTVLTEAGQEYSGEIAWDNDETASWEMLNGEMDGVEFQIEFGNIARIRKTGRGALVELRDGRTFELDGSNDVDDGNRGITVRTGGEAHEIEWEEFSELRLAEG